ncbi:MAG: UvrB/UvrC motif-containing protein [Spirochaetales bacterium]|jgi:protein arginine kinase activator|nr:UvrB/UvrC motif-containing protein [Spirochaetales bacterium]
MKCFFCGNDEAVINIRQIIGNDVKDISLCRSCAVERGIVGKDNKIELPMEKILAGLLFSGKREGAAEKSASPACPGCGCRLQDIFKEGRIGCHECASLFHQEILKYLGRRGRDAGYRGKLPKKLQTVKTYLFDRQALKAELREALNTENYETAAKIRDQIHLIEASEGAGRGGTDAGMV